MLVVISDLHLQQTLFDNVRRRQGDSVLETQIVRNVSRGALSHLFAIIADCASQRSAKELHLVFAGDMATRLTVRK
jgi:hypothetical protein